MRQPRSKRKIAYIMSRFPKITETFVLYEILAVRDQGFEVEIFPLIRERQAVTHPEAEALLPKVHFHPVISPSILKAHLYYFRRSPSTYSRTLLEVLRGSWGSLNFFLGALAIFPKVVRFAYDMEEAGVSHVHAHFANHPAVAALIIGKLTGIPYSFTAHGSDLHVDRRMLAEKVASSAFTVTVSSYNRELIVKECGEKFRDRVQVIHCGVDPDLFATASESPCTGSSQRVRIVCVGSLEEVKGHRFLVEACRILKGSGVDFTCHLVGEGKLRTSIEQLVERSNLQDRVVFHGALARPDVVQLLSGSDISVLSSVKTANGKREGIPVALMEAMAAGLPVVSSRLSGIPELVEDGHTGLLVQQRNPAEIAEALRILACNTTMRRKMGQSGRDRVTRLFNLRRNAEQLGQLFVGTRRGRIQPRKFPAGELAELASPAGLD